MSERDGRHRAAWTLVLMLMTAGGVTPIGATAASAQAAGLVGAWGFNEGTGAIVGDSSGGGHGGVISGATWTVDGWFGGALSFNGTSASVSIPDAPDLDLSAGMTLMAWIYPTTASGVRDIIIKEGAGVDYYNLYHRNWRGLPESNVYVGGSNRTAEGTALPVNTWTHVAGTYDGSRLRLFVNGTEVSSTPVTGVIPASPGPLRIGGNSLWGEFFAGRIDEVRIYNVALTAEQIQTDMITPIAPPPPPPAADAVGQWSALLDWPLVSVHMALLRTGQVLVWDADPSVPLRLWNPETGALTPAPSPWSNVFCSGHTFLRDGRLFVSGGHVDAHVGLPNLNLFDPVTQTWSTAPPMAFPRWYPTATTLADGRVLVMSGEANCFGCEVETPEIYDPGAGTWEALGAARLYLPFYPHMFVLPDGRVLAASSAKSPMSTYVLDPVARSWSTLDPAQIDGGSAVMYRPGVVMKSGTSATSDPPYHSSAATTYVLDTFAAAPLWRQTASMAAPRTYHTLTLLPDGSTLATGGGRTTDVFDVSSAVLEAELWSPVSETWSTMAAMHAPRLYHSTAVLLPDGRVLVAGGGRWGVDQLSAQVYSPPYLFKGARPTITSAPTVIAHGGEFLVSTPDAARIAQVSLVRPGAVTHAFNQDQRFIPLTFEAGPGGLLVDAPASGSIAPPGYYMLFIVDAAGIPSVGTFVRLPGPAEDLERPTPPGGLTAVGGVRSVNLQWAASGDNVGVTGYKIHRSTAGGFVPTTANQIAVTTATTYVDSGLSPAVYHYVVTARDAAGNVSDPSSEASAAAAADTTPPTITITAPASGETVSGTVTLTANVSDDVGVSSVQFLVGGAAVGPALAGPPYSVPWVTSSVPNGSQSVSARATDAAGNVGVAPSISVTVSNAVATGPVAAYAFSETGGQTTADSSGNGYTGTISGATRSTAGKFGRALSFDGVNDWVTIGSSPPLSPSTAITLMAWVFPTVSSGVRDVVIKEGAGVDTYNLYHRNWRGRPEINILVGGVNRTAEGSALPINVWTHIAGTYDGATLRLFINGVPVASTATQGSIQPSSGPLRVGGNGIWGEFFKGRIDEVRIYNRALTQTEIQAAMSVPLP